MFRDALILALVVTACALLVRLPRRLINRPIGAEREPSRVQRRRALVFWVSMIIFLLGLFDPSGVTCTLVIVFWCGLWTWRLTPRWTLTLPLICLGGVLVAYSRGYKLTDRELSWTTGRC